MSKMQGFDFESRGPDRSDRLIPMINVVFLLLTFFMVAGTMRAADTLKVEPPTAAAAGQLSRDDLILYLDRSGATALGREPMALEAALTAIRTHLAERPDIGVQLKADRSTRAVVILPVIRQLSQLGVKRLQLVAFKEEAR